MNLELRVYTLLRTRAPRLSWDLRRVAFLVRDFPLVDHLTVAARAADFLQHEATRVRDPHGALRGFFERAPTAEPVDANARQAYDRFINDPLKEAA